ARTWQFPLQEALWGPAAGQPARPPAGVPSLGLQSRVPQRPERPAAPPPTIRKRTNVYPPRESARVCDRAYSARARHRVSAQRLSAPWNNLLEKLLVASFRRSNRQLATFSCYPFLR